MTAVTTVGRNPARVDIETTPGEPVDFTVSVLDATGAPQNLTGWTLSATAHLSRTGTVLYTFTVSRTAGEVTVTAPGDDTADWVGWPAAVPWSLWLTPPASQPYLHAAGWVRLTTH